ncbi:MAG: ATP-binding protein [Salinisphaeraceae bacterium]
MMRWPLGMAATLAVIVTALLAATATAGWLLHSEVRDTVLTQQRLADSQIRQLARAGHLALVAGDDPELRQIARTLFEANDLLGRIRIIDTPGENRIDLAADHPPAGPWTRRLAAWARLVAQPSLTTQYESEIPPAGEGSALDPFGTPRADIGRARLTLSDAAWQHYLAASLRQAALQGLAAFVLLLAAGLAVAWTTARPVSRLRRRLGELAGEAGNDDIDRSLDTLGERLTRSEHEARTAAETLKTRERELERARQQERNATRLRADLVAGMSHELRAPLTAILGHADLLDRGRLDRGQREHVHTVRQSAHNLLALIDDVIQWSGLESGRTTLNEVGFNLRDIVEETLNLLAPLAFEKDLDLVHLVFSDVPHQVRGDPLRLQQILTNLVSNAIKFTERGEIVIRVMAEDEDDQGVGLHLSVTDTGPGIAPDQQARLFRMYSQLQPQRPGGSGLGLAISKRLLDMMGGEITVESEVGAGATFHVHLTLARAAGGDQPAAAPAGLEGVDVLLVDPGTAAGLALSHCFEAWGMHVRRAETHNAARDAIAAPGPPTLLVLGLRRADLREAAPADLLRASRAAGVTSLALLTSIDEADHDTARALGADRSLAKSLPRLSLHRELRELLGRSPDDEPGWRHLQVLVADDSEATRQLLAATLRELGASVALAGNGREAVSAWRKGGFPLILMDDQMPDQDGHDAIRQIRTLADPAYPPRIVGMTADSSGNGARRLTEAGADVCLVKPFDAAALQRAMAPTDLIGEEAPRPAKRAAPALASDPALARLVGEELPRQLSAVEQALDAGEYEAACRDIHTLHGTAAFYALTSLQAAADVVERALQSGDPVTDEARMALIESTREAMDQLNEISP